MQAEYQRLSEQLPNEHTDPKSMRVNHMIARRQLAEFLVEHLSNSLAKLIKLSVCSPWVVLVHTVAKIHPPRRYAYVRQSLIVSKHK